MNTEGRKKYGTRQPYILDCFRVGIIHVSSLFRTRHSDNSYDFSLYHEIQFFDLTLEAHFFICVPTVPRLNDEQEQLSHHHEVLYPLEFKNERQDSKHQAL
jgi:hypothetical protein